MFKFMSRRCHRDCDSGHHQIKLDPDTNHDTRITAAMRQPPPSTIMRPTPPNHYHHSTSTTTPMGPNNGHLLDPGYAGPGTAAEGGASTLSCVRCVFLTYN